MGGEDARKGCAKSEPQFCGCIELGCRGKTERRRGKRERKEGVPLKGEKEGYRLRHREHYGGAFRGHERSKGGTYSAERGSKP